MLLMKNLKILLKSNQKPKTDMDVKELIKELQKLPQGMEVRYAIDKGRGRQTLYAINRIEIYQNAWALLKFDDK